MAGSYRTGIRATGNSVLSYGGRLPYRSRVREEDPYIAYTRVYTPLTGANNATTFSELIQSLSITVNGDSKISTTYHPFGSSDGALLLDGTGDYLQMTLPSALGPGAYTLEGFFYSTETNPSWRSLASLSDGLMVYFHQGAVVFYGGGSSGSDLRSKQGQFGSLSALAPNAWHHWAISRTAGGVINAFANGKAGGGSTGTGSAATGNTYNSSGLTFRIGASASGAELFNGRLGYVRLTVGACRYSGNNDYTVPGRPYPLV